MIIGRPLPTLRLPALVNGDLCPVQLRSLAGQWTGLCCLPRGSFLEVLFLHQQSRRFTEIGAGFAAILAHSAPLHDTWVRELPPLDFPLLADPLGKAFRTLGLPSSWNAGKCHTLLLDPSSVCQHHLIHEFNGRGMQFVVEMLQASRAQRLRPAAAPNFKPTTPERAIWRRESGIFPAEGIPNQEVAPHA